MNLQIAADLALPLDYATQRVAVLARPEQGKTYLASVLCEEFLEARIPFVTIDTMGVFWGLRSSADGKESGYSVTIFGGKRGDVPLEPTAGALVAELVSNQQISAILDISEWSNDKQKRFVSDFAQAIYKHQEANRRPLHMVIDEADEFLPETTFGSDSVDALCKGHMLRLVKRGRNYGIGLTFLTQRTQHFSKAALELCSTLVAFQILGPRSRKAMDDWFSQHGTEEQQKEVLASLGGLDVGECWFWSPTAFRVFKRIKIRKRRTFDSSRTPKVGENRREPRLLADVDLDAIRERMAATIERAKTEDPKLLRAKIAELTRDLAQKYEAPPQEPVIKTIEVPILPPEQVDRLAKIAEDVSGVAQDITGLTKDLTEAANGIRALLQHHIGAVNKMVRLPAGLVDYDPSRRASAGYKEEGSPSRREITPSPPHPVTLSSAQRLGKGEQKVLSVLAQWPQGRTHSQLAFLAGYSAKASTLGVILSNLRRAALVEPGQPIRATEEGLVAAGGAQELPSGRELLDHWLNHPRMGEGERKVLLALIDFYPNEVTNAELCERTGYSPTASTMGVILSKLRKLGLVEMGVRRVPQEFMESISE